MTVVAHFHARSHWTCREQPLGSSSELKELLDGGVLTQEFDEQKTAILEKSKVAETQPAQPATACSRACHQRYDAETLRRAPYGRRWRMVRWNGQTQQRQQCMALIGLLFLPAFGAGLICCCIAGTIEPQDDKEVTLSTA